jgi:hypothetical protein
VRYPPRMLDIAFAAVAVLRSALPVVARLAAARARAMSDNLKFQGGAATSTEGEQRNQRGKNRDHAHDGMAATQEPLGFLCDSEF